MIPLSQFTPVFTGIVAKIENVTTSKGKWLLVQAIGQEKPLAFSLTAVAAKDFEIPRVGHKISVEAEQGRDWWFAVHRQAAVIKTKEPVFNPLPLSVAEQKKITAPILEWLQTHPNVTSDDVHEAILAQAPYRSKNIIGRAFSVLANTHRIKQVGFKRTRRQLGKARTIAVWEFNKDTATGETK